MCNKLIILCLALVVVGLSVPASAASTITLNSPLKVDIDGAGVVTPTPGWQSWPFANPWPCPQACVFDLGVGGPPWEWPIAELDVYRKNTNNGMGISANRSGGWAGVAGTGEYSPTGKGYGTNYVKLTLTQLEPSTEYKFYLWSYEARNVWAADLLNPDSKYGVWSTTNPLSWLNANGYSGYNGEPNGYGPITPVPVPPNGASGMPAGLAELVLACGAEGGRASLIGGGPLGGANNLVSFYAKTSPYVDDDNPGGALLQSTGG